VSHAAAYNSEARFPHPRCHPGTRGDVLREVTSWLGDQTANKKILWLHGPARAGKSAVAQTVAEKAAELGQLAASFFFFRADTTRNARKYFLPTLAIQIAMVSREIRWKLDGVLRKDPTIVHRVGGFADLIVTLFHDTAPPQPPLVIVDSLDECQGDEDQQQLLNDILRLVNQTTLRFLVISRPEAQIRETFDSPAFTRVTQTLSLEGDHGADKDVEAYLRSELTRIRESPRHREAMRSVIQPWPADNIISELVYRSGGYFIYPSTVLRFIDDSRHYTCVERLDRVLSNSSTSDASPFNELDKLYMQILLPIPRDQLPLMKRVLGLLDFVMSYNNSPSLRLKRYSIYLMER
jgi:hypothetical protein